MWLSFSVENRKSPVTGRSSMISSARSDSGSLCTLFALVRSAGMVQTLASRSISAHRAPATSVRR